MEKMREEIIANLRACLISTKGMSDLRTLAKDYRMLMGEGIPYSKVGYKSLEEFITSIDCLITRRGPNGEMLVDAKASKDSAHLTNMINKQKTKKKPLPPPRRPIFNYSRDVNYQSSNWKPKNVNTRFKINYKGSSRVAAVSHNQFVDHMTSSRDLQIPPRYKQQVTNSKDNKENVLNNSTVRKVYKVENEDEKCQERSHTKQRIVKLMSDMKVENPVSMPAILRRRQLSSVIPPTGFTPDVCDIYKESLEAVDPSSPLWTTWSSDDSGTENGMNSSGTSQQSHFALTGNFLLDLESFVVHCQLPPVQIKVLPRKPKGKAVLYDCTIKVDKNSYSSYPAEFISEEASKAYTAKLALDDLMTKYTYRNRQLVSTEKDILDRIPSMVQKHSNGIWNVQLEKNYADIFNEQLPSNWLEVVDTSPNIYCERTVDNRIILLYCQPGEKGNRLFSPPLTEVSVASNTVRFSENGTLMALVTCVVSAAEIWCRQTYTPESTAFEEMCIALEGYYNEYGSTLQTQNVCVGGYYVAKYETSWIRVRAVEVKGNDVNTFCIDYGDEYPTTVQNIYRMKREFAIEQAQAFVCRLAGLEELYETSKNSEHLHNLINREVVLEMAADENAGKVDPVDPSLYVIMRDSETGTCINEDLISLISIESATPCLNKTAATEVYVTNVENNGDLYVQVHSAGYEKLEILLDDLEKTINENSSLARSNNITYENSKNRLYFAKYKADDHWYRVKLIDWDPSRTYAQIYFVDYGNTDIVKVRDEVMYALDELSDVITKYPHQALKVRMDVPIVPRDFVDKVKELMPDGHPVLVKIVRYNEEGIPIVEFFKRSDPENMLFSVNLAVTEESKSPPEDGNNNAARNSKLQRLISLNQFPDCSSKNVPSTGALKSPPLPPIGEYFDVKVPCAVNPYNFCVQPYTSSKELGKLMTALQERYKEIKYSPLQIDDIQPGKIYASKHVDGFWYRTSVIKVIHETSISVFYCDFGYYANLTSQQLMPLDYEFTLLPFQAIKAKLVGIKPKQEKWTMEDCKYFENLVCKKAFVSILVSIEKDVLYKCDTVLNLKLIDTSTEEDTYVDQILVRKGIAKAC